MADETAVAEATSTETSETTTTTTDPTDWKAGLPDEIRDDPSIKDIQDIPSLAKSFIWARSKVGADAIVKPAKDAPTEEWDKYWTAIGRPEKVEDYAAPEELPEGVELDESLTGEWFKKAHELGLTRQQAAAAIRFQADAQATFNKQLADASEALRKEAESELRAEWGEAYDERMALGRLAVAELEARGAPGLKALLDESEFGNSPAFIKAFAAIGKFMKQDEIIGSGSATPFTPSPAEAKRQLAALDADPEHTKAAYDASHPGHEAAMAKRAELAKAANPQEKVEDGPFVHGPAVVTGLPES